MMREGRWSVSRRNHMLNFNAWKKEDRDLALIRAQKGFIGILGDVCHLCCGLDDCALAFADLYSAGYF